MPYASQGVKGLDDDDDDDDDDVHPSLWMLYNKQHLFSIAARFCNATIRWVM
jgi:hypothetical protein